VSHAAFERTGLDDSNIRVATNAATALASMEAHQVGDEATNLWHGLGRNADELIVFDNFKHYIYI
jgi:hypothetical protein